MLAGPVFAQSYVLPSGVISWWPGEGGARDAAGANHGTVESGVTFAPGKVGQAFSFNGQQLGNGVNLGNVPAFDFTPSASFTMEAWIDSVGATDPNDGQTIMLLNYGCRPDAPTYQGLNIRGADDKAVFVITDMNGTTIAAVSGASVSKNAWHHIAGVREVTGAGKVLKLYVDGALAATVADPTTGALALNTADYIGRRLTCGSNSTFKGYIDEPAVYSRALSAQEIAGIFQAGSAGKVTSIPPKLISGAVTTFTEDQPGVPVDPAITVENDEPTILVATVTITDVRDAGRESLSASTEGTSINMGWTPPQLTLEGTDTLANYQKVLRSVTYRNESQAPNDSAQRHVEFMVRDLGYESNRVTRAVNVISVNDPPVAGDDRFAMVGNTLLQVDMNQGDVSIRAKTPGGKGLLDNDADPAENQSLQIVGIVGCTDTEAPFWCKTANGNGIALQASGTFVVTPDNPGDLSPSDSFQYEVSDGIDKVAATVTLDRTGRVWYVKNDYTGAAPIGISTQPFRTLKEAETASQPGDTIYVFEGDGTSAGLNAGIELKAGQRLIGAGQDLVMPYGSSSVVVRAAVATPHVENTGGAAVVAGAIPAEIAGLILEGSTDGVRLAAGGGTGSVRLHNLEIRADGGTGLRVTGGGSGPLDTGVAVAGAAISAQGGPAVDIEGAAVDIQLVRLESLGSLSTGINLVEAFGRFSAGTGRIEGSAGDAVHVEGGDGEVTFSGGLTLRPASGASGFVAEGGGSVTVTGAANTVITSGGGQALVVRGTEIGAAGLTFQSLSVDGGAEAGIRLEGTGTAGGLTVTGTGTAGSGGTLQGLGGAGITLAGTAGVSLSYMNIQNNGGDGIQGAGVSGLSLTGCKISGNAYGLNFENLSGAVSIAGTEVTGSGHHDVRIANTEGILSPLSISGSRFVEPQGGYGLVLEAGGTAAISGVSLTGSTFAGNPNGLKLSSSGNGKISGLTTTASTFLGGAVMELSEAQMATLTCSP